MGLHTVIRPLLAKCLFSTKTQDGALATVVIVLPSYFTGGAANLIHKGISTEFDCSAGSQFQTSVLAWRSETTLNMKQITSGCQLALSYNLVDTTRSLRPALSANADVGRELRQVLLAWRDNQGTPTPDNIVCCLDQTYSNLNNGATVLQGEDAHKVAILDALAKELGFSLGLADFEDRTLEEEEMEYYDINEVDDYGTAITQLVDLDGRLIAPELHFDDLAGLETIPADLLEGIQEGDYELEREQGPAYFGLKINLFDRSPFDEDEPPTRG